MSDHRHEWDVDLDGYYCTVDGCTAEPSLSDAVVVCNDEERRAVERLLRDMRRPGFVTVHIDVPAPPRHCPACGYPVGAP